MFSQVPIELSFKVCLPALEVWFAEVSVQVQIGFEVEIGVTVGVGVADERQVGLGLSKKKEEEELKVGWMIDNDDDNVIFEWNTQRNELLLSYARWFKS